MGGGGALMSLRLLKVDELSADLRPAERNVLSLSKNKT